MDFIQQQLDALFAIVNPVFAVAFIILFIIGAFSPTILTFVFHRQDSKKMFFANAAAIISWIAWGTLLATVVKRCFRSKNAVDNKDPE